METFLSRYGIPTASVNRAVQSVNGLSNHTIAQMVKEFGLEISTDENHRAAKCIVHALLSGASDKDAVVNFVYKRVARLEPVVQTAAVTVDSFQTVSVISSGGIVATTAPLAAVSTITGKMGRQKLGNSAFNRAVTLLDESNHLSRSAKIDSLIAAGIKKSSAVVYLWRYNNGDRE